MSQIINSKSSKKIEKLTFSINSCQLSEARQRDAKQECRSRRERDCGWGRDGSRGEGDADENPSEWNSTNFSTTVCIPLVRIVK